MASTTGFSPGEAGAEAPELSQPRLHSETVSERKQRLQKVNVGACEVAQQVKALAAANHSDLS